MDSVITCDKCKINTQESLFRWGDRNYCGQCKPIAKHNLEDEFELSIFECGICFNEGCTRLLKQDGICCIDILNSNWCEDYYFARKYYVKGFTACSGCKKKHCCNRCYYNEKCTLMGKYGICCLCAIEHGDEIKFKYRLPTRICGKCIKLKIINDRSEVRVW